MSEPDESGRQRVVINEGTEYLEEADIIILALGFKPAVPEFLKDLGVETNSWGGIIKDSSFRTTNTKVYSGGDCVRGADLAVTAAADGRDAARKMIEILG
jgi:glutamate synthase (NADPH/NADH) small chain